MGWPKLWLKKRRNSCCCCCWFVPLMGSFVSIRQGEYCYRGIINLLHVWLWYFLFAVCIKFTCISWSLCFVIFWFYFISPGLLCKGCFSQNLQNSEIVSSLILWLEEIYLKHVSLGKTCITTKCWSRCWDILNN